MKKLKFKISDDVSNFLHFSRWLAALIVVLSHVRAMAFPPFDHLNDTGVFLKVFYFTTSLGHQAVMIFFILSGYLIGGEVMREMKNNTFSWKVYLTKRVVRLYIVLIPALILTAVFDHIGYDFYNQLRSYDRFFQSEKESLETFFVNLFMLQQSHGAIFGSNDPLWSLAYEFWYYLLFPLFVQIFLIKSKKIKIISIGLLLLILNIISWKIIVYFSIWLLGAMIWFFERVKIYHFKLIPHLLSIFFLLTIAFSRYKEGYIGDLFVGIAYVGIILYFIYNVQGNSFFRNFLAWKVNKQFADFSYSLYLLHFPFMILIFNIGYLNYGDTRLELNILNYIFYIIGILLVYIFSYLIYLFAERKTRIVTRKLIQTLGDNK